MPLVAFLAYVVKSTTGFGGAIIIVSLGSLFIGTHEAIILSAVLETLGGGILWLQDPVAERRSFWIPLSIVMIVGTIAGGLLLSVFPAYSFDLLLAAIIFVLGVWFITGRSGKNGCSLRTDLPERSSVADLSVSTFSGFCGGLFGVGGPPIVYWLGRHFAKHAFRRTLIPVFFLATVARLITYGAVGLINERLLIVSLFSFPGILLGIVFGTRIFHALSERSFSRVVGGVLVFAALWLILK